jgi:hypothetical protein
VITDPYFYLLAAPAVIALGLSKGGFYGIGQVAMPLLALLMPPLQAAAILLPIMIMQDSVAIYVYRKQYNVRNLAVMMPGAVIGIGIAWVLAIYISEAMVRITIGLIGIAFALYQWLGPSKLASEAGRPSVAGGVFWGAMSGFTSTLCQAGGPPYQMHVLPQKLPKLVYVGTTAIFFGTMNTLKVIPFFALGQFSGQGLATSFVLMPFAVLTNLLGFWLVRKVSQELFYKITTVLLFLVSLELLRGGIMQFLNG